MFEHSCYLILKIKFIQYTKHIFMFNIDIYIISNIFLKFARKFFYFFVKIYVILWQISNAYSLKKLIVLSLFTCRHENSFLAILRLKNIRRINSVRELVQEKGVFPPSRFQKFRTKLKSRLTLEVLFHTGQKRIKSFLSKCISRLWCHMARLYFSFGILDIRMFTFGHLGILILGHLGIFALGHF